MPGLLPEQCRAGRALLDWTQEDLAERAEVSRTTVREFEKGHHGINKSSAAQIVQAFAGVGVVMVSGDGMGPGVRLVADPGRNGG